jgi:hypothetical protein
VKFLQQNPSLLGGGTASVAGGAGLPGGSALSTSLPGVKGANLPSQLQANLQGAGTQLQALQAKMGDADQAKAFMQQRRQLIGQYLVRHGLSTGPISKLYGGMNQQVYYYSQQLRQYKEMWTNPDELTQKALAVLNQLPAFQTFMKDNSMLGGLFHVPGSYSTPQAISGLQLRCRWRRWCRRRLGAVYPEPAVVRQEGLRPVVAWTPCNRICKVHRHSSTAIKAS